MSAEVSEKESASEPPKVTKAEALAKLEGYRCAICQTVVIHACRIDCGHTFCRYCLNVDKEDRIGTAKPTCFICDAAITEISNTIDRDKEIDKLYTVLSTEERLSRERAKSERKEQESNFANRPKKDQSRIDSDGSSGSGDVIYNMPDSLEGASWGDYGHDENDEDTLSENESPMYFCGSYAVWSDEHGLEERGHSVHEGYDEGENSSSDDGAIENSGYVNSPFPQPIVIHHTVQHIYHTVDGRARSGSESIRHMEVNSEWRGQDHAYPHRYQNYGSPRRRTTAYQDYSFHNHINHYRNSGPTYASAGYYTHHYNTTSPSFGHASAYSAQPVHQYCTNHESYPHMRIPMYTQGSGYPHGEYDCEGHSHECPDHNSENADRLQEECCTCEGLCEFHRSMRDGAEPSILYAEEQIPPSLSHCSSHNRIVFESDIEDEDIEEGEEHEDQELFTFNVTIPMSVAENLSLRRESYESSCASSHNAGASGQMNARCNR